MDEILVFLVGFLCGLLLVYVGLPYLMKQSPFKKHAGGRPPKNPKQKDEEPDE